MFERVVQSRLSFALNFIVSANVCTHYLCTNICDHINLIINDYDEKCENSQNWFYCS